MAPLNELANLLYEAARDIQAVARTFSFAANDAANNTDPCGPRLAVRTLDKLRDDGLPLLGAMNWDVAKLEALRHALAIEEATK